MKIQVFILFSTHFYWIQTASCLYFWIQWVKEGGVPWNSLLCVYELKIFGINKIWSAHQKERNAMSNEQWAVVFLSKKAQEGFELDNNRTATATARGLFYWQIFSMLHYDKDCLIFSKVCMVKFGVLPYYTNPVQAVSLLYSFIKFTWKVPCSRFELIIIQGSNVYKVNQTWH